MPPEPGAGGGCHTSCRELRRRADPSGRRARGASAAASRSQPGGAPWRWPGFGRQVQRPDERDLAARAKADSGPGRGLAAVAPALRGLGLGGRGGVGLGGGPWGGVVELGLGSGVWVLGWGGLWTGGCGCDAKRGWPVLAAPSWPECRPLVRLEGHCQPACRLCRRHPVDRLLGAVVRERCCGHRRYPPAQLRLRAPWFRCLLCLRRIQAEPQTFTG